MASTGVRGLKFVDDTPAPPTEVEAEEMAVYAGLQDMEFREALFSMIRNRIEIADENASQALSAGDSALALTAQAQGAKWSLKSLLTELEELVETDDGRR